ncbi:Zn-dependent hydrolase, including glyoxylase [Zea mays]|uniref:Zn-dependent hydrolase, including glyoxylase n=1 Tax=Zea mays TaxID=4577 RepID=A0A1D6QA37_MAIZE|nr:Zn-dependent hydrolase, including glyoxylase [Zea mays]
MALMSLGAAGYTTATAPPRPRRCTLPFRAAASPAALDRRRRPHNVAGDFFVDHRCIDCQTCRWMAPEVFKRVDGKAAVAAQPSSEEERTKALQALLSCPTSSIHTEKPPKDILKVQNMFPLPIDDKLLPGVYLCGYNSEDSYGATSYLVIHPQGNILIDSPRYTPKLANNIEKLGGARYMFLTHIDDVADHRKWAEQLKCERIIHSGDPELLFPLSKKKYARPYPSKKFNLIDLDLGSVCLYFKPLKVLFTGDHVAKSEESDDLNLFLMYSKQSVSLQLESIRKLLELEFEWLLPGHGYRIKYKDVRAKNVAMESLLANYTS